jgi:uncharacterized membrane protein affecting hemolysin expression
VSDINPSPIDNIFLPKYRLLLGVVIIITILIAFALGAVVVGMFTQANKSAPQPVDAFAHRPAKTISMSLAPGFKILSSDTQPGRLIVHIRSDTKDEIDIIDLNDGRIIARIHAASPN